MHCAAGAEAHKPGTKPTSLTFGPNSISSRFSRLAQAEKQAFSATLLSSADLDDPSHLTLLSIEVLRCVNPTLNIHPDTTAPFLKLSHLADYGNSFAIGACRMMSGVERGESSDSVSKSIRHSTSEDLQWKNSVPFMAHCSSSPSNASNPESGTG